MFIQQVYKMQHFKLMTGDVTQQLATLPDNFFDAVLSDPPYGISFMGKAWDHGVPSADTYAELLRVLKPGAMGLHFGGTRMWHRLAVNLEDAGFELRDTVMWLYGSGFPKSHNISKAIDKAAGAERTVLGPKVRLGDTKAYDANPTENRLFGCSHDPIGVLTAPATPAAKQWDGWGTALKPAWEPALLVQKPLAGTFANNALTHGCGGLNIDGCRVGDETIKTVGLAGGGDKYGRFKGEQQESNTIIGEHVGRFPANLILDEEAGAALGEAQRFFYCAKVSTKERNAGLGAGFKDKVGGGMLGTANGTLLTGSGNERNNLHKNNHPTLKPLALTEYLAKLLLVPERTDGQPRRLLVPFSGAGSEMIGALLAGWDEVWGIELDPDYVAIAAARITHHTDATEL